MRMKLVVAAIVLVGVSAPSASAQDVIPTMNAWNHWRVADSGVTSTGKTPLANALDQIDSMGYDIFDVVLRPKEDGGYVYDIIGKKRGAPGMVIGGSPQVQPQQPPQQPSTPPTSSVPIFGTNCPGFPFAPFPGAQCYSDGGWRSPDQR